MVRSATQTLDDLRRCQSVGAIASATLERALKVMGTALGNVQLIEWRKSPTLKIVAQRGFEEDFLDAFRSVSAGFPSACGRALITRDIVFIEDVREDADFAPFRTLARRAGFQSVQSTPMISTGGALYGVVSTHAEETGHPDDRQMAELRRTAREAADAIARLRARRPQAAIIEAGQEPI